VLGGVVHVDLTAAEGELTPEQGDESAELGGQILMAFKTFTAAARTEIAGAVAAAAAE